MGGPTADTCGRVSCLDDARVPESWGAVTRMVPRHSANGGGDPGVVSPAGPLSGSCSAVRVTFIRVMFLQVILLRMMLGMLAAALATAAIDG